MNSQSTAKPAAPSDGPDHAGTFVYDVDGKTYEHDRPRILGSEIMAEAEISAAEGLVKLLPDGTAETVNPDDEVTLVPGAQFRRRPRFRRG